MKRAKAVIEMKSTPITSMQQFDAHRLIPSSYSGNENDVLSRIADDGNHLSGILALERVTNNSLAAENNVPSGIDVRELVFDIPFHQVINETFLNANPQGSRFNGATRGAWYAGFCLETSQAEVAWRKTVELAEIDYFHESTTYHDYIADFSGQYHDIRKGKHFKKYLTPDSYVESQLLAYTLLAEGSSGIVHPSVRHRGGTCISCFRPALVFNVRKSACYRFTWASADKEPHIELEAQQ